MHRTFNPTTILISSFSIFAFLPKAAYCEETSSAGTIEEIVVTAQKRSENLQKVPIAITAVTPERMATAGVRTTQDLAAAVPGLQLLNIAGMLSPRVRGVGSNITAAGLEAPVATYVDGVYLAFGADTVMDFSDATQISVIKGPQGTLFGRNATGGVLQVTTRSPDIDFTGVVRTELDNYLTTRSNLFVTGGLSDSISASLAASYAHQGRGWGTNIGTGNDTYRLHSSFTVRGKIKAEIGDATMLLLSGDYTRHSGSDATNFRTYDGSLSILPAPQPERRWDTSSYRDAHTQYHGGGASVTIDHDFGDVGSGLID